MSKRPQDTSAEEPDGGNPHIRFRGGPGRGNQPGLLNTSQTVPTATFVPDITAEGVPVTPGVAL